MIIVVWLKKKCYKVVFTSATSDYQLVIYNYIRDSL